MKRDSDDERTTIRKPSPGAGGLQLGPDGEPITDAHDPEARRALRKALRDTAVMTEPPVPIDLSPAGLARDFDVPEARYLVRKRLGLGGMGEVNDTYDMKIGREVAMKTMLRTAPHETAALQERFLREARVQAQLEHPAIVPVYDIGFSEDNLPYFTMKRVRGETLHELFFYEQNERASIRKRSRHRLLSSFVTVCLALDYAHQRGVIHRDLKPDNVMLGANGEVYVLDWGLAKILSKPAKDMPAGPTYLDGDTRPGEMVGTPGYMPPEQVLGNQDDIDALSDVYALGAILFELLTQAPRHPGRDIATVLESTMDPNAKPSPPPADVPPELYALALQATSFFREQRPPSARVLAERVERYLDGDRDEGLRKKLADERVMDAKREQEGAASASGEAQAAARAAAMHQAGRALALVPEHPEATRIVLELLAQPPATTPPAVRGEIAALNEAHMRTAMRDNAIRISSWLLFAPVCVFMGIETPLFALLTFFVLVACAATSVILWMRPTSTRNERLALYVGTSVLFALMSGLFGSFILVPALTAVNTLLFAMQFNRKERPVLIGIGAALFLLPVLLELAGLVPPSFEFVAGKPTLLPRMISFPPALTVLLLTVVTTLGIATPTLVTGRMRDALRAAERKLVLQKWQLYQLSPAQPPRPS